MLESKEKRLKWSFNEAPAKHGGEPPARGLPRLVCHASMRPPRNTGGNLFGAISDAQRQAALQ